MARPASGRKKKSAAASAAGRARRSAGPGYPAVGTRAPDFSLPNHNGEPVKLSHFRGKNTVVLYFYPRDNTSGCTRQACGFCDLLDARGPADVMVLGVSPDSPDSHTRFRDRYELPFTLLSDRDHAVAEKYGVWQDKSLYGRKYKGIARTTFVIDRAGKVARVFEKVKVPGHADAVFEWIDANL